MSFATIVTADNDNNNYTIRLPGIPDKTYSAQNITLEEIPENVRVELIDIDNLSPQESIHFDRYRIKRYNPGDWQWHPAGTIAQSSPYKLLYAYFYSSIHNRRWQREYPLYRRGKVREIKSGHQMTVDAAYGSEIKTTLCYVDYMECHAYAFAPGDWAVIRYDSPGYSLPLVIGFWYDPKGCWFEDWLDASGTLCTTNTWAITFVGIFGDDVGGGRLGWAEGDYDADDPSTDIYYAQWIWGDCELDGHPETQNWPSYDSITHSHLWGKFIQEYPVNYDTDPFEKNHYGGFIYTFKDIEDYPITDPYDPPDYPPAGTADLFTGDENSLIVIEGFRTWYEGVYKDETDHPYHLGTLYLMFIDSNANYAYLIFLLPEFLVPSMAANEHFVGDGQGGDNYTYSHSGARVVVSFDTLGLNGRLDEVRMGVESTWQWRRVPCFKWDKLGFFPSGSFSQTYTGKS